MRDWKNLDLMTTKPSSNSTGRLTMNSTDELLLEELSELEELDELNDEYLKLLDEDGLDELLLEPSP